MENWFFMEIVDGRTNGWTQRAQQDITLSKHTATKATYGIRLMIYYAQFLKSRLVDSGQNVSTTVGHLRHKQSKPAKG